MSAEFLLGAFGPSYQPSLFFFAGLLGSFACCLMAMVLDGSIRGRENEIHQSCIQTFNYKRFRNELISSQRHLGFATGEVHELEDHDFRSDSE